jgi:hypothetical protein
MILRPKNVATPDDSVMVQCWNRNPDGGGVMWQNEGVLYYIKGMMTMVAMRNAIAQVPKGVVAAFHFRIGTNGANTAKNTHPWPAGSGRMLMHNGIVRFLAGNPTVSDSKLLGDLISSAPVFDKSMATLTQEAIGFNNKVIVMDGQSYTIVNDTAGVWDKGCWFSNTSFNVPKYIGVPLTNLPYEPLQQSMFLSEDTLIDEPLQFKSVRMFYNPNVVQLTDTDGVMSELTAQEFLANYADLEYTPPLRLDIDRLATQYAMNIERKNKK